MAADILAARAVAAAMRQNNCANHRDQQDQPCSFEQEHIFAIQQGANGLYIWHRCRHRRVPNLRRAKLHGTGLIRADTKHQLSHQNHREQQAERYVFDKTRAQFGKINIKHHDNEQEQDRDRTDIDNDQQHRDELCTDQHHKACRVEEGDNQPQHAVHRIARENDHRGRRDDDACEDIEGYKLDHDGSPLTIGCIGGKVRGNCPFPFRAVVEKLGLVIKQFLACFGCKFEVWTLDNCIHWASFLAETAIDALRHVDVIARGAAAAVFTWF